VVNGSESSVKANYFWKFFNNFIKITSQKQNPGTPTVKVALLDGYDKDQTMMAFCVKQVLRLTLLQLDYSLHIRFAQPAVNPRVS